MSIDETVPSNSAPAAVPPYEFNAEENRVFADLAWRARSVGLWFIIFGILVLLSFIQNPNLGHVIVGLVLVMVGGWSRQSASGFDAVAKTQGSDVGHLMEALRNLAKLYSLLDRIIFCVVLFNAVILIAAVIAWAWASTHPPVP